MISVLYRTEEEISEPKAREIMTGFNPFFAAPATGDNQKVSRRDLLASRREARGKSGISPGNETKKNKKPNARGYSRPAQYSLQEEPPARSLPAHLAFYIKEVGL